jgi:DNA-binding NarL/FixJ family response regulator
MEPAGGATMTTEPPSAPRRIGVVEDDPVVLTYFTSVLGQSEGLEIAFVARSLAEAREAVSAGAPDLCLVDLGLPDGSGIDLLRELKAAGDAKVLVATVLGDRSTVLSVLKAGADGYILKTSSADDILSYVRQTLDGFTPISAQVATYLMEILRPTPAEGAGELLTAREAETLAIFSRGLSYDETARVLGISANTVRDFVRKIYAKLRVHNRSEALFEARNLGLLDEGNT